jgi:predicted O-linked N-acetylglucosamine transferase (SPINDLY family)
VQLKPDYAEAHNNLGNVFQQQGKLDEALACYRQALHLRPNYAKAHNNLGNVFEQQGKLDEALACYRQALHLKPDYAEAHSNVGNVLQQQGKLDAALAWHRRALQLRPHLAEAHSNLGNALKDQGQLPEALACYRQALQIKPDDFAAHSNFLAALQYRSGVSLPELAEAHAEYQRQLAARLPATSGSFLNVRDPDRCLRLGFLSPDLARHPVGSFLIRALEKLDRCAAEVACYSNRLAQDDLTARFQAIATTWHDVVGWSDERLAQQVRSDKIDILFDLAGHTSGNRLLVFARKPAPIQITWLGYEGTTGLQAMDYILADPYLIPQGAEKHYPERVLRLPEVYVCYDPPLEAPPPGPLPALSRGYVTFGSCNNLAKINSDVVAVWAKILRRLAGARLVLKYKGLNDAATRQRYLDLFAAQGIEAGRLDLLGPSPYVEYLAHYQGIDAALDPFPFAGGVTTCQALWMGVPVVTCPGATFASRHAVSYLTNIGMSETIAADREEYVEKAVDLAGDLPRLAELRGQLREQMARSPLCDGQRFASNLLVLLRQVWRHWLASP